MDCSNPISSWDMLARLVFQYDPQTGCSVLQGIGVVGGDPMDCDNLLTSVQEMLNLAFDSGSGRMRVAVTSVLLADLCHDYAPVSCTYGDQLLTLARKAFVGNAFRVAQLVGFAPCTDCEPSQLLERLTSTFVKDVDGQVSILIAAPESGSPDVLNCDLVGVTGRSLVQGSLGQVGDCGMWAIRSTIQ